MRSTNCSEQRNQMRIGHDCQAFCGLFSELILDGLVSVLRARGGTKAPPDRICFGGEESGRVHQNGWFAARPSGTEDLYKLYAESFLSEAHLQAIVAEAQQIVLRSLG